MALNRPVDEATARAITDPGRFVEAIIAPSFAGPALDLLTTRPSWKANVRLIEVGDLGLRRDRGWDYRRVTGGLLVQSQMSLPTRRGIGRWLLSGSRPPMNCAICDSRGRSSSTSNKRDRLGQGLSDDRARPDESCRIGGHCNPQGR